MDTLFTSPSAAHRSLTVELTSNPAWTAVTSLPALINTEGEKSATDWATQLYALVLGHQVAQSNPDLQKWTASHPDEISALSRLKLDGLTDLTPWLREAMQEEQRGKSLRQLFDSETFAARKYTALDKLKALQGSDGGWSWYEGMPANPSITLDVAVMLARMESLTGSQEGHNLLEKALAFLQTTLADEVKAMKKAERESGVRLKPSEFQLRCLYLYTLMGHKMDQADLRYLYDRAKGLSKELSMYGKAIAAVVFVRNGAKDEAALQVKGILEHTVYTSEMGRYFDSKRAESTAASFRILTQCMAIEALNCLGQTKEAEEMRQWLMQCKRTQMWQTSLASADAVYALLSTSVADHSSPLVMSLSATTPVYYTLMNGSKIVGVNAPKQTSTPTSAGYYRVTYTDASAVKANILKVRKDAQGLAWGTVYATEYLPASSVKTEGAGLHLNSLLQVYRGGSWTNVTSAVLLQRGDRVRQVFTLKAERDFDFVELKASRPACAEPLQALSGYQWRDGLPAYRAVQDASTTYYIERVAKGTHTLTEESFVNRAGTYASGISMLKCVYAPEYAASAQEIILQAR